MVLVSLKLFSRISLGGKHNSVPFFLPRRSLMKRSRRTLKLCWSFARISRFNYSLPSWRSD